MEVALGEKLVAIVPAKNEQGRVGRVVKALIESKLFARVLVVDDGSTDSTAQEARSAGADVISHPQNRGKAAAMATGVVNSVEPILCFFDADLRGVNTNHLNRLVDPVRTGKVQASLALLVSWNLPVTLAQLGWPSASGQRCIRRDLLDDFNGWGDGGYQIEYNIEGYLREKEAARAVAYWLGVDQVMKELKWGAEGHSVRKEMYKDMRTAARRNRLRR